MAYVPALKEALKNPDVVFLYFANGTSDGALRNFIKQNELEGENVLHYNLPQRQQKMLERKLEVNVFPSYMLVNKEGKLVDKHAPRPSQKERLVLVIEKLLAE